jgi:ubiquitin-conjugating enzyme E2 variant
MEVLIIVLSAWFIADIIAGIFHWWQDRYLTKNNKSKLIAAINAANDLHHEKPGEMAKYSFWFTVNTTATWAWPLAILMFYLNAPIVITLSLFFGGFANQIHKWSHTPKNKLHWIIRLTQSTGLFISHEHHAMHHYSRAKVIDKENTTDKYCPMTDYMNPILDHIKFWAALEYIVSLFGIHPTKRTK